MSGRMDRSSEHHQRNFYSRHHLHKDLGMGSDSIIFLSSSTETLQTSNWTRHNNNWQWWRFIKSGHQLRIARHHCWAVSLRFSSRGLLCPPFNSFKFLWTWLSCGGLDNGTKFLEPIRLRISCIRASSPEKNNRFLCHSHSRRGYTSNLLGRALLRLVSIQFQTAFGLCLAIKYWLIKYNITRTNL